jgi:hypothetical protein
MFNRLVSISVGQRGISGIRGRHAELATANGEKNDARDHNGLTVQQSPE